MKEAFGRLSSTQQASLYTISCGKLTAAVTDFGAALVRLLAPDRNGKLADVVLGYDDAAGYAAGDACLGATVGRNANRIAGAAFTLGGSTVRLAANENGNSLHSGPDFYHHRLWQTVSHSDSAVTFRLESPSGDQGFPGNAVIQVTYALEYPSTLRIQYDFQSDRDTVFNPTNHSYFNLAGHENGSRAMDQVLMMPSRIFCPADAESILTGEEQSVAGTPMDFRVPKALGRDIDADFLPLRLQSGYDHNFEVFCNPCAILSDPVSGRTMAVITDRPGVQLYTGNFLNEIGKGGVKYGSRSGVCLETQYFPDAVHHPQWAQPVARAGQRVRSVTKYQFL